MGHGAMVSECPGAMAVVSGFPEDIWMSCVKCDDAMIMMSLTQPCVHTQIPVVHI